MINQFIDLYTENLISQLAQDETGKRQYYRPIYSLHKWWARRPGALFRAIILLARATHSTLFNSSAQLDSFLTSDYFQDHDLSDTVIFDPFMGGGTTLVEANRLGAKVIGCDVNPVSVWIVRETLKSLDLEKLEHYFQQLDQTAGAKIRALYQTTCPQCQAQADSIYVFWVRSVHCLQCGQPVALFKRTLLNTGFSRTKPLSADNPATVFCPTCWTLHEWSGVSEEMACTTCQQVWLPQQGTYNQGYYRCTHCGEEHVSLLKTLKTGQRLQEQLVAIEYLCRCRPIRRYKAPDTADLAHLQVIDQTVQHWKTQGKLIYPQQTILAGASSVRWRQHNYHYYAELFSPRQLLAFNYLFEALAELPEVEYRYALVTIFSNSLEYNNMMTPYNYPHRKLHHLFTYHALPLTTTPVENVVWGVNSEGAGTFRNCYQRYVTAKQYAQQPFDKFKDTQGVIQTVWAAHEKIEAQSVASFEELIQTPRGAWLLCRDSSQVTMIPNQSIDFIITDPPYFDSIHYSELSNFFYVWLKCLLPQHHYFTLEQVPTVSEAIGNAQMQKGEQEYQDLLTAVFRESHRVLKPVGKLIFTFHHTKWRVWWIVLNALLDSGFQVVDYFPVASEYKVNPHIRNKQALDMDLVLVCQKGVGASPLGSAQPEHILQRSRHKSGRETMTPNDNQLFLYFMGELLKTAGSLPREAQVTYHWFEQALRYFEGQV